MRSAVAFRRRISRLVLVGMSVSMLGAKVHARVKKPSARRLIERVVASVGGVKAFRRLGDVRYTYVYRMPNGHEDVSQER